MTFDPRQWTDWGFHFVCYAKTIEGKRIFMRRAWVRYRMYDNPFSVTGFAFHRDVSIKSPHPQS